MKKKVLIGSIFAAAIIIIVSFTPAVCAENLNSKKIVTIKTTYYQFLTKEEIINEVSEEEAEQIMDILEQYRQSLIQGDKKLIEKFESILIDKGIIGENHKTSSKKDIKSLILERYRSMTIKKSSSLVDENRLCFVNARGQGNLSYMFDEAFESLAAAGILLLLLCIILPPFMPILGLPAIFLLLSGLAGLVITHLIPFRILYPKLFMHLTDGDCSINGLNGSQQYPAPVTAIFYGFSGLTVNFFTGNPSSVFLLGFAFRSEVL